MAATTAAVVGAVGAVGSAVSSRNQGKAALKQQEDQNQQNTQFIKEQAAKARQDVIPLFDAAQQARLSGAQGALDVFGQSVPAQLSAFQQGNQQAQAALLAGLPQVQNAILGLPTQTTGFPVQGNVATPELVQNALAGINLGGAAQPGAGGSISDVLNNAAANRTSFDPSSVTNNADLLAAAVQGHLGEFDPDTLDFFNEHLGVINRTGTGTDTFLTNPEIAFNVIGGGGFNAENQARLANLVNQFQNVRGQ